MLWILIAAAVCAGDLLVKHYIDTHKEENCHPHQHIWLVFHPSKHCPRIMKARNDNMPADHRFMTILLFVCWPAD